MSAEAGDSRCLRNAEIPVYGTSGLANNIDESRTRDGRAGPGEVVLRRPGVSVSPRQDSDIAEVSRSGDFFIAMLRSGSRSKVPDGIYGRLSGLAEPLGPELVT